MHREAKRKTKTLEGVRFGQLDPKLPDIFRTCTWITPHHPKLPGPRIAVKPRSIRGEKGEGAHGNQSWIVVPVGLAPHSHWLFRREALSLRLPLLCPARTKAYMILGLWVMDKNTTRAETTVQIAKTKRP